jgi:hypothetical protein
MALAQIGPATGFMEALATAIGAGMVIGGFLAGIVGMGLGWHKPKLDRSTLAGGYAGGGFAVLLLIIDLGMRYKL